MSRTATALGYGGEKTAEALLIVGAFMQGAIKLYQTISGSMMTGGQPSKITEDDQRHRHQVRAAGNTAYPPARKVFDGGSFDRCGR